MMKTISRIIIACLTVGLISCSQASDSQPTITVAEITEQADCPEVAIEGTILPIEKQPTHTPCMIDQPLATPTRDFIESPIAVNNDYIFTESENCTLPCWMGLTIGESTSEDVQTAFNYIHPSLSEIDFFDPIIWGNDSVLQSKLRVEGMIGAGYSWKSADRLFAMMGLIDSDTGILKALQLDYSSSVTYYKPRSISDVVWELGQPDLVYTRIIESTYTYPLQAIALIYEEGLVLYSHIDLEFKRDREGIIKKVALCLDATPIRANDFIIESFDIGANSPLSNSIIVDRWIMTDYVMNSLQPLEDTYGLSPEEFTHLALSDDPCLELDSELYP